MDRHPDGLKRLTLEVLGLTAAMGCLVVVAAFHVFGGLGPAIARMRTLPFPDSDPLRGKAVPLTRLWPK